MKKNLLLLTTFCLASLQAIAQSDNNPSWGTGGESVIRDPKGVTKLYTKESAGTALLNGRMILYQDDFPTEIVWGDNNEVYVKDIIGTMTTDSYIKGEKAGDIITFEAGQLVDYVPAEETGDGQGYGIGIGIATTEVNGQNIDFTYDPSIPEFSMKINEDGSIKLILPETSAGHNIEIDGVKIPEYVLCLFYTDDFQFIGFSDFYQDYYPEEFQIVTMPEGIETEEYVFVDEYDYADLVEVGYTDEYVYIRGLNPMMPESVVRAKREGNTATIPQNQYTGVYMNLMYIFTRVLTDNPAYNPILPGKEPAYIYAPADTGFTLTIDREGGKITADTPGVYLSFQPDTDNYEDALFFLSQFTLTYQKDSAGTPANPSHLKYSEEWVYYYGFSDFQFNISNYSNEGTLLDTEHLYYQVVVNGEPVIFGERLVTNLLGFEDVAYEKVPGSQRWLPYDFINGRDIEKWGNIFDIGIYVPDVKTIGVQSLYNYEDTFTYSDMVTLDVATGEIMETPSGVERVMPDADFSGTLNVYDLKGTKVMSTDDASELRKLPKGLYIINGKKVLF